ncbi:MAG: hypothetical protein KDJ75_09235 [Alphaproteobacteria bacterium]|nr:hypothetical protein [Alphaproteobacteria bacterium]
MKVYQNAQCGSALFFILIAVALFAALSYTVSNMIRGGSGETIITEKMGVYADDVLGYGRQMRQAVQAMRISNGCSETDISFEHTALAGYTHTPAASDSCKLFHPSGGGMSYQAALPAVNSGADWIFTGANDGTAIGTQCDAASCADLVAILPGLGAGMCKAINEKLGLASGAGYLTQEDDSVSETKFQGTYSFAERIEDSADADALEGKMQGCFEGRNAPQSAGTYYFYQILVAR